MNRKFFIQSLFLLGATPKSLFAKNTIMEQNNIRLLRHATLLINIGKIKMMVDPMLSAKDEMDPVQNCGNDIRIPMVDLPVDKTALNKMLDEVDAVVITHTHRDHWDLAAQNLINKNKLIFCQPSDAEKIRSQGFLNVKPIDTNIRLGEITISRTHGQHGTGEIGKKMGEVSDFVFSTGKKNIYVAGDTIWCRDVEDALNKYKPNVIVVNAGAAKFLSGDPITMTPQDIIKVYEKSPKAKLIAVHMDAVNHCFVKRTDLQKAIFETKLLGKLLIPLDGEVIEL
ncbi:MAG: MBL fold metallo-hydrolase [Ferruginibacter sp.]